jgi:hypothetical protein
MRTDGLSNMMKLIDAFGDYENVPKKKKYAYDNLYFKFALREYSVIGLFQQLLMLVFYIHLNTRRTGNKTYRLYF